MIHRLRLATSLVLFVFVVHHLVTHSLGLVSLAAVEAGGRVFVVLWRSLPATVLLFGALIVHFALGLYALYRRRSLAMRVGEAVQLLLGLAAVPLLAEHVLGTRLLADHAGVDAGYTYVILVLWKLAPDKGLLQAVAVAVVWSHAMIGLYYWLRLKPWFVSALPLIAVAAALVPLLALGGFVSAGREVEVLARDVGWLRETMGRINWPQGGAVALVEDLKHAIWLTVAAALILALAARVARDLWSARGGRIAITYGGLRTVSVPLGTSVLEASRMHGIPHASVCGGRGRCSTCRVRVKGPAAVLPEPSAEEIAVLRRIGIAPNLRLACQLRPRGAVAVTPLLPPTTTARDISGASADAAGKEEEIAILFADVRDFTGLAEQRLPYDVVFILNRYFAAMGEQVEAAGGRVDKFIGDGVMALFGIGLPASEGCRQALAAARGMAGALKALNKSLKDDLAEPIRIGIGIHVGPVIIGEMGFGRVRPFTAIGDTVNTASRLEALTKNHGCQLIVSTDVERASGAELLGFPRAETEVRGRAQPLEIVVVEDATRLPITNPAARAS
jgi:adenylate cyclase